MPPVPFKKPPASSHYKPARRLPNIYHTAATLHPYSNRREFKTYRNQTIQNQIASCKAKTTTTLRSDHTQEIAVFFQLDVIRLQVLL
jgi:hypothetical protein